MKERMSGVKGTDYLLLRPCS